MTNKTQTPDLTITLPIQLACLIARLFVKDHAQQIKPQQFRLIAERKISSAPSSLDGSQDSFQCL